MEELEFHSKWFSDYSVVVAKITDFYSVRQEGVTKGNIVFQGDNYFRCRLIGEENEQATKITVFVDSAVKAGACRCQEDKILHYCTVS